MVWRPSRGNTRLLLLLWLSPPALWRWDDGYLKGGMMGVVGCAELGDVAMVDGTEAAEDELKRPRLLRRLPYVNGKCLTNWPPRSPW